MNVVIVEYRAHGNWRQLGPTIHPGDAPGSLSHNGPGEQRQVYVFGFEGERATVRRSRAGADIAAGLLRVVMATNGFEHIAELSAEEPTYECWIKPHAIGTAMNIRFRLVEKSRPVLED